MVVMSLEQEYGDQATALYHKYAGRVQGFLISMGCDRGLAEEITDDAFLAVRRRWAHVQILNEPEGYVFKIARNECSKRQKQHDCRRQAAYMEARSLRVSRTQDPKTSRRKPR
jgi:DNA-directed RNA polymerase specialized sigma24 family protein